MDCQYLQGVLSGDELFSKHPWQKVMTSEQNIVLIGISCRETNPTPSDVNGKTLFDFKETGSGPKRNVAIIKHQKCFMVHRFKKCSAHW